MIIDSLVFKNNRGVYFNQYLESSEELIIEDKTLYVHECSLDDAKTHLGCFLKYSKHFKEPVIEMLLGAYIEYLDPDDELTFNLTMMGIDGWRELLLVE